MLNIYIVKIAVLPAMWQYCTLQLPQYNSSTHMPGIWNIALEQGHFLFLEIYKHWLFPHVYLLRPIEKLLRKKKEIDFYPRKGSERVQASVACTLPTPHAVGYISSTWTRGMGDFTDFGVRCLLVLLLHTLPYNCHTTLASD